MPRIKPQDKTKMVELKVKIREDDQALLTQYAKFLNDSSEDHVITAAIRLVADDKEFKEWLRRPAETVSINSSTGRISTSKLAAAGGH